MNLPYGRRDLLTQAAALAVTASLPCSGAEEGPPNIVLILGDDLGYGDLGCYGQKRIRTPHIDRLAAEGLRFTQFYAGSTVCSPSRCVLMTGLHTGHARIRGNSCLAGGTVGFKGEARLRRMHLTAADVTVAGRLREAGYRTCLVGKWHLDGYEPSARPLDRGFDEFHGHLTQTSESFSPSYFPTHRYHDRKLVEIPGNRGGERNIYETDLCQQEACRFIRENAARRFFLYLCPANPHSPLVSPDLGPYAGEPWDQDNRTYASMVGRLDDCVGAVLRTLSDLRLERRTIVFFASDNGPRSEATPPLTAVCEFFDSNGPLRGYKRDLYEGGIRVPLIARWPGRVPSGKVTSAPGYFADFLPTALELAGRRAAAGDGASLVPLLTGSGAVAGERAFYWETFERGFRQAARMGRWKAVRPRPGAPLELFDIEADPGEGKDLAPANAGIVARMEEYLRSARAESPEYPVRSGAKDGTI